MTEFFIHTQGARQIVNNPRPTDRLIGYAVIVATVAGSLAIILAVLTLLAGEWLASGVSLLAAGVTFGLLANAYLRT